MAQEEKPKTITRVANAQWKGSLRAEIQVRDCAPFFSDEPKERGGLFESPTPAEYVISAISGCSVAHVEMFAKEVGMLLDDCQVEGRLTMGSIAADASLARTGGVAGIELDIRVTSSGTEAELHKVRDMFREKCVLYRFAKAATNVNDSWELVSPE